MNEEYNLFDLDKKEVEQHFDSAKEIIELFEKISNDRADKYHLHVERLNALRFLFQKVQEWRQLLVAVKTQEATLENYKNECLTLEKALKEKNDSLNLLLNERESLKRELDYEKLESEEVLDIDSLLD